VALAEGGTLLLDEIGDLPLGLQPKLLRFIQDREYERVGDPVPRRADVRILAATNQDLEQSVRAGSFREDLLYRLNVVTLEIPPLRSRREDVPALAARFLAFFARQYHKPELELTAEAGRLVLDYPWPGNVRELRNAIERAAMLAEGPTIGPELLLPKAVGAAAAAATGPPPANAGPASAGATIAGPASAGATSAGPASGGPPSAGPTSAGAFDAASPAGPEPPAAAVQLGDLAPLSAIEQEHIRRVLARTASLREAAAVLGIDQATLWRRRKQYGL
jgi:transcriptional regulator with GAF, ATPase, and Fis domain